MGNRGLARTAVVEVSREQVLSKSRPRNEATRAEAADLQRRRSLLPTPPPC